MQRASFTNTNKHENNSMRVPCQTGRHASGLINEHHSRIKIFTIFSALAILFAILILAPGCKKSSESVVSGPVPVVTTGNPSNLLINTVFISGNVTSDGGIFVTKRGFCWSSSNQNPTIKNDTMGFGNGSGSFTGTLKGLKGQTNYYVRAFGTNTNGTGYGSIMSIRTIDTTITDVDNNHYRIIQIGTQVWMAENLKTTTYKNGTSIPLVTDNTEWGNLTTFGYCWYNNDEASNKSTYGALYNQFTVASANLAPTGWHIPTDAEWTTLTDFLGGESVAGGKLKEKGTIHWLSPNGGATNETSFTALPGGFRSTSGTFSEIGDHGLWWSSSEYLTNDGWYRYMDNISSSVSRNYSSKMAGLSVRCVRD